MRLYLLFPVESPGVTVGDVDVAVRLDDGQLQTSQDTVEQLPTGSLKKESRSDRPVASWGSSVTPSVLHGPPGPNVAAAAVGAARRTFEPIVSAPPPPSAQLHVGVFTDPREEVNRGQDRFPSCPHLDLNRDPPLPDPAPTGRTPYRQNPGVKPSKVRHHPRAPPCWRSLRDSRNRSQRALQPPPPLPRRS